MKMEIRFYVLLVSVIVFFGGNVWSQSLVGSDITLVAQKTFEWRKKEGLYKAEGEVTLKRGNALVQAERVWVYYHELDKRLLSSKKEDGLLLHRPQIYRLVMEDGVFVSSEEGQVTALKAVYERSPHVFAATGGEDSRVKFSFSGDRVIEAKKVSYWIEERLLVGEGEVLISGLGVKFLADKVVAFFEESEDGDIVMPVNWQESGEMRMSLRRVEVEDNLRVEFDGGRLEGRQGYMDVAGGKLQVCGNVRAEWLSMVLEGDCVDVDLKLHRVRLVNTEGELDGIEMRVPFSRLNELVN